jgi:hypothetical protein
MNQESSAEDLDQSERAPFRVRIPGFLVGEDVGLGTAINRVTYVLGIKSCRGCDRRAAALDRRVVLSGKPR